MSNHLFPSLANLQFILTILTILIAIPSSYCDEDEQHAECNKPYTCGKQMEEQSIWYPFWGNNRASYCGRRGFELQCHDNQNTTIQLGNQTFRVLQINVLERKIVIARDEFFRRDLCSAGIFQETMNDVILSGYRPVVKYLSFFYDCGKLSPEGQNNYSCPAESGDEITAFYTIDGDSSLLPNRSNSCKKIIKVPFLANPPSINNNDLMAGRLKDVLTRGFELEYDRENKFCKNCLSSLGICGSNQSSDQFLCLCRDKPHPLTCSGSDRAPGVRMKLGIGILAGSLGITTVCIIICIFRWKKISSILYKGCCAKISKPNQDLEDFIRNYGPLAPKRYSYSDVKKMTDLFKYKLGQGGYGSVYKGKLPDACLVAVKLLYTSKGNGKEFINEVASIIRTSHVNVITLLGFCFEGSKRALIYEFMPNGSLEKFIINGDASKTSRHLEWEKMYEIVTGIARGLEYLHRGCNTRILHFDIKPHNILLDKDFCPKISDFGMAKLCPNKESIVSMLEARGTIGYIAPEVFSRNFGEVSHKSDVYSYGMMILELVGCKNNDNAGVDHSSEIYFPGWIYRHFEEGKDFKLPGVVTSEENEIVKKMIIVGLWCIQIRPSDRPSMNKVIEMLQVNAEALQIPLMPFLSSPARIPTDSSTISMDNILMKNEF